MLPMISTALQLGSLGRPGKDRYAHTRRKRASDESKKRPAIGRCLHLTPFRSPWSIDVHYPCAVTSFVLVSSIRSATVLGIVRPATFLVASIR